MPSTSEFLTGYFDCVSRHDIDGMLSRWKPGSEAEFIGMDKLRAPEDIRAWFGNLFRCFPDFRLELREIITEGNKGAVRWRATATFDGEGTFEGFKPNGAKVVIDGIDLVTLEDQKVVHITALFNGLDMARQLGAVPPRGSLADRAMAGAFNAKTAATAKVRELRDR